MKTLNFVLLTTCVLFASCIKDNTESCPDNKDNTMMINAYIVGGNQTKANTVTEKQDWVEGDELGVFVCDGTIDQPYLSNAERYVNVAFRHNGKGFICGDIYLDENPAEIFAYYPYNALSKVGSQVPVESSTQTDYLYGHAETPASISQKNVNIAMKHALSQVVFRIKKSPKYTEGDCTLTKLTIENNDSQNVFKTAGTLDLSSGLITGTSNMGTLTLMPGSSVVLNEEYQTISSICLPVGPTSGKNIKAVFEIDGKSLRYEFPQGTQWAAGFRNIYTLTVENSGLEIGGGGDGSDEGITIEPWEDNTDGDISLVPIL